jgi:hypothetical protein
MPVSDDLIGPMMSPKEESIDRKCAACKMKEEEEKVNQNISRKSISTTTLEASEEIADEINDIRSSGRSSLDSSTKEFMETRFGYDFSKVKIHTSDVAARSANSVNAQAYTIGENIVFDAGYYQPNTSEGRRLLAHELTHVVQQHGSRVSSNGPLHVGEGLSIHRQTTMPPPDATLRDRLLSQVKMLRRMWSEKRYGCCGPGNVCDDVRDDIDSCCKQHDLDYARLGVTSGPSSATAEDMWSSEGLKRSGFADLRLVACTQATKFDFHFYGPAAWLYRDMVALIFGGRAAIAATLRLNPWISW